MSDEWEVRMARRRDGSHRAKSRDTAGADRDLLYDDAGNLLGPTESREPDFGEIERIYGYRPGSDDDDDDGRSALTAGQQAMVDVVITAISELSREVIGPLIREVAIPALKQRLADANEARRSRPKKPKLRQAKKRAAVTAETTDSAEVAAVTTEPKIIMTGEQYRQHFLLTIAVEKWLAQHKGTLSRAVVVDDTLTPDLQRAINLVLEGKGYLLDDEATAPSRRLPSRGATHLGD